jgi:RimJ/RimL family protein N-acetyltransferase
MSVEVATHPPVEGVSIRPFRPEDAVAVHRWFNNQEAVATLMEQRASFSMQQANEWVERAIAAQEEDRKWAVCVEGVDEPVGFTALYGLFRQTGVELGIMIGDPSPIRGTGREGERQACGKAFEEFGAHKVYGRIPAFNIPAKKAVAWMGWTLEGVLRDHIKRPDGSLADLEVWGVTEPEWRARWGKPTLSS